MLHCYIFLHLLEKTNLLNSLQNGHDHIALLNYSCYVIYYQTMSICPAKKQYHSYREDQLLSIVSISGYFYKLNMSTLHFVFFRTSELIFKNSSSYAIAKLFTHRATCLMTNFFLINHHLKNHLKFNMRLICESESTINKTQFKYNLHQKHL